jgi:hypothetical protein
MKTVREQTAKLPDLTPTQEAAVNDCYEWLITVYNRQQRWLNENDLWTAYPFKRTGMGRHGFTVILNTLKKEIS